jgi:hypothetical protein
MTNVTAEKCPEAGRIFGLPEMPVEDVVFTNVSLSAETELRIANAKGIRFVSSRIKAAQGEPVIGGNAEVSGLGASE